MTAALQAPDVRELRKRAFVAASAATCTGDWLEAEWQVGVGVGITLGMTVCRDDQEMAGLAFEGIASYRQLSYAGAADALTVTQALAKCFRMTLAGRAEVARACGVMRGFSLATAERADAVSCPNCCDRLLPDLMTVYACPSGYHPASCNDECAREFGCGRSCAADAGLL